MSFSFCLNIFLYSSFALSFFISLLFILIESFHFILFLIFSLREIANFITFAPIDQNMSLTQMEYNLEHGYCSVRCEQARTA